MSGNNHYENLILGGGESGKYIGWTLARSGQGTAVIERRLIGGSCPNIACLPSKNVIHSAKVAELCRRADEFGTVTGPARTDMAGVLRRKRNMVDGLISLRLDRFRDSGTELILGEGRFVAPKTIEVSLKDGGTRQLTGDRVFLDLGTRAAVFHISGLSGAGYLTHVEALDLDRLPPHLIVLGGGYVGLEMGQAFRRLGSRVTIIERGSQLASREDYDVAQSIRQFFEEDGIEIVLSGEMLGVEGLSGERVRLQLRTPESRREVEGTDILVAIGRTPNTAGIGLAEAGVEMDARGYIKVNERLETTAPGVWAMGECAGSPQFTHVAFDDYRVVRDNLAGGKRTTTDRLIPFCMFTDPELARVGLNETEARNRGVDYRLARLPMGAVLRTRTLSETRGFMKALVETDSDRLLGFTMLGPAAGEVIAVVQTAMLAEMPYTRLRDAIFTHPTMAEGLNALFATAPTSVGK
jgi:pyruvate/2-oxoglutarate dehydrogenase complex dihydrolipoamide dehydrogenase (E3) component